MTTDERENLHLILDAVIDTIEHNTNVRMSITQSYVSVSGWRTYVEVDSRPSAMSVRTVLDALDELKADASPHDRAISRSAESARRIPARVQATEPGETKGICSSVLGEESAKSKSQSGHQP